jgi:hypothetical protein
MKHIIIGDLHGKDYWKEIDINAYDKMIFLGDYVDHWNLPDFAIYQNLADVIALKKKNPDKVELLLGNHDVQYLHYPNFLCSGFRSSMQRSLTHLFSSTSELFKIAYQIGNHLFTHAGVTNSWFRDFIKLPLLQQIKEGEDTVAALLNKIEQTAQRRLLHRAGTARGGYGCGGPTWADRKELTADMLDGYHQVVGHTVVSRVEVVRGNDKSATFIDVLDSFIYFHELDC